MDSLLRLLHGMVTMMISHVATARQMMQRTADDDQDISRIYGHLRSLQEDLDIMIEARNPEQASDKSIATLE